MTWCIDTISPHYTHFFVLSEALEPSIHEIKCSCASVTAVISKENANRRETAGAWTSITAHWSVQDLP